MRAWFSIPILLSGFFLAPSNLFTQSSLDDGFTQLMNAALHGHIERAERLLQEGANLEERDDFGWTALHWASNRPDNLGMIQFLIDHGANLATKDECGQTAMDLSRGRELESNIAVLKKHDAPSNVHGSLFAAVKIGDIEAVWKQLRVERI